MFNPFRKIREAAKAAFLGGIQDGLAEILQDKPAVKFEAIEDKPEEPESEGSTRRKTGRA